MLLENMFLECPTEGGLHISGKWIATCRTAFEVAFSIRHQVGRLIGFLHKSRLANLCPEDPIEHEPGSAATDEMQQEELMLLATVIDL
jgi:hypothetical protein